MKLEPGLSRYWRFLSALMLKERKFPSFQDPQNLELTAEGAKIHKFLSKLDLEKLQLVHTGLYWYPGEKDPSPISTEEQFMKQIEQWCDRRSYSLEMLFDNITVKILKKIGTLVKIKKCHKMVKSDVIAKLMKAFNKPVKIKKSPKRMNNNNNNKHKQKKSDTQNDVNLNGNVSERSDMNVPVLITNVNAPSSKLPSSIKFSEVSDWEKCINKFVVFDVPTEGLPSGLEAESFFRNGNQHIETLFRESTWKIVRQLEQMNISKRIGISAKLIRGAFGAGILSSGAFF